MENIRKLLILCITAGVFFFSFFLRYNSMLKNFTDTADSTQFQINQYAKLSSDFVDLMGVYGNEFFMYEHNNDLDCFKLLKANTSGDGYTIDSIEGTDNQYLIGNLTGIGQIPKEGHVKKEILLALKYNSYFSNFFGDLPGIAWIYYTSKNRFINLYPWVSSEYFKYTDELWEKDFYKGGLPQNNPGRRRFWSPVYLDLAGKGLMVTVSRPIYDNDEFLGVVSLDFTTNQLSSLLKSRYQAFLVNEHDQVLAATFKTDLIEKQVVTVKELMSSYSSKDINEIKDLPQKTIHKIGNAYVYAAACSSAPWRLYYLIPVYATLFSAILFSLPVLVIGVLLVLSNNETVTRKKTEVQLKKTVEELKLYQSKLEKAATMDFLTTTLNRRGMAVRLDEEVSRYDRSGNPFSLIMCDVDHFKEFNDHFGHAAGDRILVEIASTLKNNVRNSDLVCRWGGEEFLIILTETLYIDALIAAEKLRREIEKISISFENSITLKVTMTFGVNEYNGEFSIEQCISQVDHAMYRGKEMGRNIVSGFRLGVYENQIFSQK